MYQRILGDQRALAATGAKRKHNPPSSHTGGQCALAAAQAPRAKRSRRPGNDLRSGLFLYKWLLLTGGLLLVQLLSLQVHLGCRCVAAGTAPPAHPSWCQRKLAVGPWPEALISPTHPAGGLALVRARWECLLSCENGRRCAFALWATWMPQRKQTVHGQHLHLRLAQVWHVARIRAIASTRLLSLSAIKPSCFRPFSLLLPPGGLHFSCQKRDSHPQALHPHTQRMRSSTVCIPSSMKCREACRRIR
jgi:hypothetical protein